MFLYILQRNLQDSDVIVGVYDNEDEPMRLVRFWLKDFKEEEWGVQRHIPDVILIVDAYLGTIYTIFKKELNKTY